jgi:inorganic pyrophosphatase
MGSMCATAQIFAGLLVGAMLPYWFSAMTMKSVGKAALAMVEEVRRQFNTIPGIMEGTARPDYRLCVEISTTVRSQASFPLPLPRALSRECLQGSASHEC